MARKSRFHYPGTLYHVMLRGNNGNSIFFSDEDMHYVHFLLEESIKKFDHSIYAFCLMNNHIHLAIKVEEISISAIMQNIAFRYTCYINKKYGRVGHLFQGRFKSIRVDENVYFLELIRYIHLNPVRAKLVGNPKDYHWSSHKAYFKMVECTFLKVEDVLKRFGSSFNVALKNFEEFILQGIGVEVPPEIKNQHVRIEEDEIFADEIIQGSLIIPTKSIQLTDIVKIICSKYEVSKELLAAPGKTRELSYIRGVLALLVREFKSIEMAELALFLNRDSSSVFKLTCRLEKKSQESSLICAEIEDLKNEILKYII